MSNEFVKKLSIILLIGSFSIVFLMSVRNILSTPLILILLIYFLFPYRNELWVKRGIGVAIFLFILWLFYKIHSIFFAFFIGFLIAYLLEPFVQFLEKMKIRRTLALILLLVLLTGIIFILLESLIPHLIEQFTLLVIRVPQYFEVIKKWVIDVMNKLRIPFQSDVILREIFRQSGTITQSVFKSVLSMGKGIGVLVNIFYYFFLAPILGFYMLKDMPKIRKRFYEFIQKSNLSHIIVPSLQEVNVLLGRYVRGQLLICIIDGILIGFGLWIFGIDYSALLGIWSGLFQAVPNIGFIMGILPAIFVSMFCPPIWISFVKVIILFVFVNLVEGHFIIPRIMSRSVDIHPLLIILSLLVGAYLFGFVGLLFAVPAAVVIKVVIKSVYNYYWTGEKQNT